MIHIEYFNNERDNGWFREQMLYDAENGSSHALTKPLVLGNFKEFRFDTKTARKRIRSYSLTFNIIFGNSICDKEDSRVIFKIHRFPFEIHPPTTWW